jgi:Family of unknown function (DUF6502)
MGIYPSFNQIARKSNICDNFPSMTQTDHALLRPLLPIAKLSLAAGLKLPDLIEAMKTALVQAASEDTQGKKLSDSQLSVLTGVHRKDLRRLKESEGLGQTYRASLSSQVFGRWRSDPSYLTKGGAPRVLNRSQPDEENRSFETLVASVSTDVHPRSVLDDLMRLGIVEVSPGDRLKLVAKAFIPKNDAKELWEISAQNASDHLMAIAHNLLGGAPQFLEQAIFTDELSAESAAEFNRLTAHSWKLVFEFMLPELRSLIAKDKAAGTTPNKRVNLGMYSYVGDLAQASESIASSRKTVKKSED